MIDFNSIKTLNDFWSRAAEQSEKFYQGVENETFYDFVFLNDAWTKIQAVLNLELEKEGNKLIGLFNMASLILAEHDLRQNSNWNQWSEKRLAEFKGWVDFHINDLLPTAVANNEVLDTTIPKYSGLEEFFISEYQIIKSYRLLKEDILDNTSLADFLSCFDLNNKEARHPKFKARKQADFVYYLSMIKELTINNEIALDRFGIKAYRQQVNNMTERTTVFKNQVEAILKKH